MSEIEKTYVVCGILVAVCFFLALSFSFIRFKMRVCRVVSVLWSHMNGALASFHVIDPNHEDPDNDQPEWYAFGALESLGEVAKVLEIDAKQMVSIAEAEQTLKKYEVPGTIKDYTLPTKLRMAIQKSRSEK
jgi:hypothetical protein